MPSSSEIAPQPRPALFTTQRDVNSPLAVETRQFPSPSRRRPVTSQPKWWSTPLWWAFSAKAMVRPKGSTMPLLGENMANFPTTAGTSW